MTTDITIGKLIIKTLDEVIRECVIEEFNFTPKYTFLLTDFLEVEECPSKDDGCTQEDTIFPGRAYRSMPNLGAINFFNDTFPELGKNIKPWGDNSKQITRIKPYIEIINKTQYTGELIHERRLHWLKFWCNEALELYGEQAAIEFS